MSEVLPSVEQVAKAMPGYRIVVIKSTCPLRTPGRVHEFCAERTTHLFEIVVNPEFLKEGAAVDDFIRPDPVVIRCEDVRVQGIMKELYAPFMRTGKPILCMDLHSASRSPCPHSTHALQLAMLRRIALNLIKKNPVEKVSQRQRRIVAPIDADALAELWGDLTASVLAAPSPGLRQNRWFYAALCSQ